MAWHFGEKLEGDFCTQTPEYCKRFYAYVMLLRKQTITEMKHQWYNTRTKPSEIQAHSEGLKKPCIKSVPKTTSLLGSQLSQKEVLTGRCITASPAASLGQDRQLD